MRSPRFSIAGLMALVAIIAVDCGIISAFLNRSVLGPEISDLIAVGALPMENLLAFGLMALWEARSRRRSSRPLLARFEVCGGIALLGFLVCATLATHPIHEGVGRLLRPLGPGPLFLTAAAMICLLPQIGLALVGLWLDRKYRIRISIVVERRSMAACEAGPPLGQEPSESLSVVG